MRDVAVGEMRAVGAEAMGGSGVGPSATSIVAKLDVLLGGFLSQHPGVAQSINEMVGRGVWGEDLHHAVANAVMTAAMGTAAMDDVLMALAEKAGAVKDACHGALPEQLPEAAPAGGVHPKDAELLRSIEPAKVAFSRACFRVKVLQDSQEDLEKIFQKLVDLSEVKNAFVKVMGLAVERAKAHASSGELLLELREEGAKVYKRFVDLHEAAEAAVVAAGGDKSGVEESDEDLPSVLDEVDMTRHKSRSIWRQVASSTRGRSMRPLDDNDDNSDAVRVGKPGGAFWQERTTWRQQSVDLSGADAQPSSKTKRRNRRTRQRWRDATRKTPSPPIGEGAPGHDCCQRCDSADLQGRPGHGGAASDDSRAKVPGSGPACGGGREDLQGHESSGSEGGGLCGEAQQSEQGAGGFVAPEEIGGIGSCQGEEPALGVQGSQQVRELGREPLAVDGLVHVELESLELTAVKTSMASIHPSVAAFSRLPGCGG
mmetsp:Transcript_97921/g.210033  ORF Transcript_97921/g.210033 Transcript_97921/m.210033 type:complete len:485 (+) Transcript_97921:408-1862(+)